MQQTVLTDIMYQPEQSESTRRQIPREPFKEVENFQRLIPMVNDWVSAQVDVPEYDNAETGGNKVVSAEFAKASEIRAQRSANGDWPSLRKSSTFAKFSLKEQFHTLVTWMLDMEDYIENIQAGAVPVAKFLGFFDLVNVHLYATTERMDDLALTLQQVLVREVKAKATLARKASKKAELAEQEADELLERFALRSAE
ncbi:hypothetical protein LTS15_002383 [Exophiala xenobiotica]|nr:hypothetical protein LTS15_002383 [Exophiala xenobiotica]